MRLVMPMEQVLLRTLHCVLFQKMKTDLLSYRFCVDRINSNLDRIQELRSTATKVTVTYRDAPGSSSPDSDKSAIIARIVLLEKQIDADSRRLQDEHTRIRFMIDSLDNFRERQVLQEKYLNGNTWRQISSRIYIEERWVRRIHNRAIRQLIKKLTLLSPPKRVI